MNRLRRVHTFEVTEPTMEAVLTAVRSKLADFHEIDQHALLLSITPVYTSDGEYGERVGAYISIEADTTSQPEGA